MGTFFSVVYSSSRTPPKKRHGKRAPSWGPISVGGLRGWHDSFETSASVASPLSKSGSRARGSILRHRASAVAATVGSLGRF